MKIPDFDPNLVKENPIQNLRFKPMRDVMEMGSVFKIFNTALAYENGLDTKEYEIDEPLMIYDKFGKKALQQPIDDVATICGFSFFFSTTSLYGANTTTGFASQIPPMWLATILATTSYKNNHQD